MNESSASSVPTCIGIIMDGNRRWARARGLPVIEGHRAGAETLKRAAKWIQRAGIKHVILYTFSTENWHRPKEEVDALLSLMEEFYEKDLDHFAKENAVMHFVGDLTRFSQKMQEIFKTSLNKTAHNTGAHLYFALNYGGRQEILSAVRAIVAERPEGGDITEDYLRRHLQTGEMPDPDLIIRTSGEQRLSGFLPWQSVYSELYFTPTLWPDFSEGEFDAILADYAVRDRRRGT